MTEAEKALVRRVQHEGGTNLQITKTPGEFRVRYDKGNAYMGRAIVYDIGFCVNQLITDIKQNEKELYEHRTT